jgi:predicted nucleic acid-binding protein
VRIALDTNVLAYGEGIGDAARQSATHSVLESLPASQVVVPAQALGELFRVLTAKGGRSATEARSAVLAWSDAYEISDSTLACFVAAMDLVAEHRLQFWDSLILNVAAESGCRLLLSEDLQHEFTWRGVTIVNPYAHSDHPLLAAARADGSE